MAASAQAAALSAEQAKGECGRAAGGPGRPGRLVAVSPFPVAVLAEVIKAFGAPENAQRMEEARDNACNDMGKMLQFLLPVATQIQQDVIKAYGFSNDGEGGLFPRRAGSSGPAEGEAATGGCLLPTPFLAGVLKFARLIKSYESQDPEIASMSGKLKAMFLPPMTLPPHGAGTGGVAAS